MANMHFVFDNIIYSKEKQGGISNYWHELTKSFSNNNNAFFYEEKTASDNIFRKQMDLQNLIPHMQMPLSLARLLPVNYQSKTSRLLYHSSFYRKLITNAEICEITTIHDFLHQKHSSSPVNKIVHNILKFGSIKRAQGIICVSNYTLLDLKRYCAPKKTQKVEVIYNGISDEYKPLNKEDQHLAFMGSINLTDKYLLFVGARSKYKNFEFVVELLNHLAKYKLIVVGNILSSAEKGAISKNLLDRIVVANNISNNDLNILYNYAHALLYPSSYEGFGFPVVEAMRAGCPVLALNLTSIPEISGGVAVLFDDLSIKNFVKAIKSLEQEDERIAIINQGLQNAKRFDWTKCCRETMEFYKEVYG